MTKSDGRTISCRVSETWYGPGGKIIDYRWDYARTRRSARPPNHPRRLYGRRQIRIRAGRAEV